MTDAHSVHMPLHMSDVPSTPSKASSVSRRPLASLEANTLSAVVGVVGPAQAHLTTPSKPASHFTSGGAPKPSPGPLRTFFPFISPELQRIRNDPAGAEVDARQLECDETLGPIPIYLDSHEERGSGAGHGGSESLLSSSFVSSREPMKSPLSTLLSVVKPATPGVGVDLPTPRGLSFTFGDMHSPLTVTNISPAGSASGVAAAAHTTAPPVQPPMPVVLAPVTVLPSMALSASQQSLRSDSRNSQDTIISPPPQQQSAAPPAVSVTPSHASADSPSVFSAPSPRFTCAECAKSFPSNSALAMHLLVHSGDKPFACPQPHCAKRFRQKGHLVSHYRKHTGEKPFACPGPSCQKRFKDKSGLNTHVKRQHPGVSAVHVTASTPPDADDAVVDPALEAAIAEANVTLQALQSSTMAAAAAAAAANGQMGVHARGVTQPPRKRVHAAMDRATTPAAASAASSMNAAAPVTALSPHVASNAAAADASAFIEHSALAVTAAAAHLQADEKERELESLAAAQQHHHQQVDALGASLITQEESHAALLAPAAKRSRGDLSPAGLAPRMLTGMPHLGHMLLHHERGVSGGGGAGSGSYSPLTTAPSPISFSNHLHMRVASISDATTTTTNTTTRSGQNTPTAGMSSVFGTAAWMPQVPLPAPVTAANTIYTHPHATAAAHYHPYLPPVPVPAHSLSHSHPLSTSSGSTVAAGAHAPTSALLFNPSSTSAFSFKAAHAIATPAVAL